MYKDQRPLPEKGGGKLVGLHCAFAHFVLLHEMGRPTQKLGLAFWRSPTLGVYPRALCPTRWPCTSGEGPPRRATLPSMCLACPDNLPAPLRGPAGASNLPWF